MSEFERIQKYINRTKATDDKYGLRFNEILEIAHMAAESPIDAICLAFDYGRAKGYRAAKREAQTT